MTALQPIEEPTCAIDDPARLEALARYQVLDTEFEAAFDGIVKLAAKVFNAPIAVINFVDANRQWFKAETGLGIRETPLDISICRHAILEHDTLVITDTLADPRTSDNPLTTANKNGLRFYAGALLKSGPHPLGTLCVLDYTPREFTPEQLEALTLIRDQVMHLLEFRRHHMANRQLVSELDASRHELQRQAHVDPLTGLLNRRAFEQRLQFELDARLHGDTGGTLLMIDLDDFKKVNDREGHLFGDRVLHHVGQSLHQATRGSDVLGRWGGDEFLVLLPGTDIHQAREVARRVLDALARTPEEGAIPPLGASIGLSTLDGHRSVAHLLQTVDTAMYQAKHTAAPSEKLRVLLP